LNINNRKRHEATPILRFIAARPLLNLKSTVEKLFDISKIEAFDRDNYFTWKSDDIKCRCILGTFGIASQCSNLINIFLIICNLL